MRQTLLLLFMLMPFCADAQEWKLVWSDELTVFGEILVMGRKSPINLSHF